MTTDFQRKIKELEAELTEMKVKQKAFEFLVGMDVSERQAHRICYYDEWNLILQSCEFNDTEKRQFAKIIAPIRTPIPRT